MPKRGYVYAVCQQGNHASVKVGYTTLLAVEQYVHESYSRSLSPLQILRVLPTSHASLAEKNVHHYLTPHRLHHKHELFDLSSGRLSLFDEACDIVRGLDRASGLPVPLDRFFCYERWALGREAARQGSVWETRALQRERAELARQERKRTLADRDVLQADLRAFRGEQKAEAVRARQAAAEAAKEAAEIDRAVSSLVFDMVDAATKNDTVRTFVDEHMEYTGSQTDYVERSSLYKKYMMLFPHEQVKKTALGYKKWFEQLKIHLGEKHYHAHPRLDEVRRPRHVWFTWKLRSTELTDGISHEGQDDGVKEEEMVRATPGASWVGRVSSTQEA